MKATNNIPRKSSFISRTKDCLFNILKGIGIFLLVAVGAVSACVDVGLMDIVRLARFGLVSEPRTSGPDEACLQVAEKIGPLVWRGLKSGESPIQVLENLRTKHEEMAEYLVFAGEADSVPDAKMMSRFHVALELAVAGSFLSSHTAGEPPTRSLERAQEDCRRHLDEERRNAN